MIMKTIKERAAEYAHKYRREVRDLSGERTDAAFAGFIAGAKSERKEMLQWDDHIEDNLEMEGKPDHIGEATEMVDWGYWRRMYAGMAMQGFCRENVTMNPASMVANVSVEYADALIAELKKPK